jgi:predicted transcriptional regulator
LADDAPLDRLFHALADDTRRWIWAELGRRPGMTTNQLAEGRHGLSRWAVMKHLGVLRDAGLIQTLPEGNRRQHFRDPRALDPAAAWLADAGTPGSGRGR